jgi:hypothetical protein
MMMKKLAAVSVAIGLVLFGWALPDLVRAASPTVNQTVAIVDPYTPVQQAGVDVSGNLKVNCTTGCGAGTSGNNADTQAAVSTGLSQVQDYGYNWNGTTWDRRTGTASNGTYVSIVPTSSSAIGQTPTVSASAVNNVVLKSSPGNLYGVYATNLTGTAGFLVVLNAISAPGDGSITPLACVPITANGVASINFLPGPPAVYSTGIVAIVTSAATCFTKTTGTITAFIAGQVS